MVVGRMVIKQRPWRDLRRRSAVLQRAGWAISDQVFSSLTNFAVGVLVARSVTLAAFGAYSLAFAAYLVAVSVTRAYPMDPLAIRYAAATKSVFKRGASAATGSVLLAGCACGLVLLVSGLVLLASGIGAGGTFAQALVALGITLPGLLLQDAWRSTFFASGRGRLALINDVTWAAVEFPAFAFLLGSGHASVFWLVLAWGGSACVAALLGILQASVLPRPMLARAWWSEHTDLAPRFIAEAGVRVASGQLALYGVGLVAGLATVGALRAGQLLFGPIQVVFFGVSMMAVPEGARALAVSRDRLRRAAVLSSAALAAGASAWAVIVLMIPTWLGTTLLRDAWEPARALVVPLLLTSIAGGMSYGGGMGLRALAAARRSLSATLVTSVLTLVMGVVGAAYGGAPGCAWAFFLVALAGVLVWWYEYVLGAREHAERSVNPATDLTSPPFAVDGIGTPRSKAR